MLEKNIPVLRVDADTTLRWCCRKGDFVLWARLQNWMVSNNITLVDVWEMKDGDCITITNRRADLPAWFNLHPGEVAGSAAYAMMKKLKDDYKPQEKMEGQNIWRVLAGDRLSWVGKERPGQPNVNGVLAVLDLRENILVVGESTNPTIDPVEFGALSLPGMPPEAVKLGQAGIDAMRKLGTPRVIGDRWSFG